MESLENAICEMNDPRRDEIRLDERKVRLTNQQIIELAYLTKVAVGVAEKNNCKLSFEEANCYLNCYYTVRKLLKSVNPEYVESHDRIKEFYREDRELSNNWDRLHWESKRENKERVGA